MRVSHCAPSARRRSLALRVLTSVAVVLTAALAAATAQADDERPDYKIGVARVDITPDYPIRLSGYGGRRTESEGVIHPLWAKALAIQTGDDQPAVLVTVDNVGVPDQVVAELADRLAKRKGLSRAALAVCSSHTHTGPCLSGMLATLFGVPIPPEHQERIDRYTGELTDKLEQAAVAALDDLRPGQLAFAQGEVGFAGNRRTRGGPVDHSLPLLRATDNAGNIRALLVNYACHCTALDDNMISGDWAGYAQIEIERGHPDAVAMIAIGCGADSDPYPRTGHPFAQQHGNDVAREVNRLLEGEMRPIAGPLVARLERVALPFDKHPTRAEWEQRAQQEDAVGYHARVQLERLDRGESLQTEVDYPVQAWLFGDDLAMVFLAGEVVVDYSLRLKSEFAPDHIWVAAYSNDVPCYIPSQRILDEGGYEGGSAMTYYNRPARLAPGVETLIVDKINELVPREFWSAERQAENPPPKSPDESLQSIQLPAGFRAELVAAEPLVVDPVAIDFGADGELWVVEMHDYPTGLDANWQPGGRLKRLVDDNGDGRYDRATLLADDLPFPTGVMAWRNGALVCAAPDILYVEDTDTDGRLDKREKLFTGFLTENYQARVNGLSLGLDNWIHGANGLLGGVITTPGRDGKTDLGARDIRFRPDTRAFEPTSGLTQQGRVRDDWGNWFGCTNGELVKHYPLDDAYLRRNPHLAPPPASVYVPAGPDGNRLHSISRVLARFNDPDQAERATSACGVGLYRDTLLGEDLYGDAFTPEPVHNLVTRRKLVPAGVTFQGVRSAGEEDREFLASTDNWFRPVQARTGPDGALWIVDMYRFVIEHPRWITPERLAQLDVRAGHDRGRIYRVYRESAPPHDVRRLSQLATVDLARALDVSNGTLRDNVQRLLLERADPAAIAELRRLAVESSLPACRVQALCALDGLTGLDEETLAAALRDEHPAVRRHGVRLAEQKFDESPALLTAALAFVDDADPHLRQQLAYSLGAASDPRAAAAIVQLATAAADDGYQLAAALSSVNQRNLVGVIDAALADAAPTAARQAVTARLLALAADMKDQAALSSALTRLLKDADAGFSLWQLQTLADVADRISDGDPAAEIVAAAAASDREVLAARLAAAADFARDSAGDAAAEPALRSASVRLLGALPSLSAEELETLGELLGPQSPAELQAAVVAALARRGDDASFASLLERWPAYGPSLRAAVLDSALGRANWTLLLLDRLERGEPRINELDAVYRQNLVNHANDAVRQRAAKLIDGFGASRRDVVDAHRDVLALPADVDHGVEVFRAKCAVCHRLRDVGHPLGPDLAALTDRSGEAMLVAILDPNRAVEAKFTGYVAITDRGLAHTGVIAAETDASITLRGQEGVEHSLLRSEIEHLQATGKSFMPEGLEQDLSRQDMADVIAYVGSHRAPRKQVDGNEPREVAADDDGVLRLPAAAAEIYGQEITFEAAFENIGYWHGPQDHVAWTVNVERAGPYEALVRLASADDSAGCRYVFQGAGVRLRGVTPPTGGYDQYQTVRLGTIVLTAGKHRFVLRPDGPLARRNLMDLAEAVLAPYGSDAAGDDEDASVRILELLDGLAVGTPKEYQRIPDIFSVAIAAGKRGQPVELRRLIAVSLPPDDAPLAHWQAVVLGGGVVNGLSQRGEWPAEQLERLIGDDPHLAARWRRALDLAVEMLADEAVPNGTRYDALRMLGAGEWENYGAAIRPWLAPQVNGELQMGAVSALADVQQIDAAAALLESLSGLGDGNRRLAFEGLLRSHERVALLLDGVERGSLPATYLPDDIRERLLQFDSPELAARARGLLTK